MNIVLYSTHCPKCDILQNKLNDANIQYELCTDKDKMIKMGFRSAPILEVDGKHLTFIEAIDWIKER